MTEREVKAIACKTVSILFLVFGALFAVAAIGYAIAAANKDCTGLFSDPDPLCGLTKDSFTAWAWSSGIAAVASFVVSGVLDGMAPKLPEKAEARPSPEE
ncbi:MAG TPA: hypothetical protein VFX15_08750 [Actinomycetes bacterium]|nr:hypothetical protein [Actinomycetes bacterium]